MQNTVFPLKKSFHLRMLSLFSLGLFLLIMLVSTFIVIPKFNEVLETQHNQNIGEELKLEGELFIKFVERQKTLINDLANYPSLTSAVMLSDKGSLVAHGLLDNVSIGGTAGRLVLQDIEGNIIIQTTSDLLANYYENEWFEKVLDGSLAFHIQLLHQKGLEFTFKMSVPIIYHGSVEGVLSAEITVFLEDIFIDNNNVAYKLIQKNMVISTGTEHIIIPRESVILIPESDITFVYITDDALIQEGQRELKNTILFVLLVSFVVSFFIFVVLGYRGLLSKEPSKNHKGSVVVIYALPLFICIIGLAGSITAYLITLNIKDGVDEKEMLNESKQEIQRIREKIDINLQTLGAVKSFFIASNHVSRDEFKTFVTPLLLNLRNIRAVGWTPYVLNNKRAHYIQQAKVDGLIDFNFIEKNNNGSFVPAQIRDTYFPVYYAEPFIHNKKAIGFDLASNKKRFNALTQAKNTYSKVATAPINLILGTEIQKGILVFNAVFNTNVVDDVTGLRELLGFTFLVLKVENLIQDTLNRENTKILLYIEDITDLNNIETLYGRKNTKSIFNFEEKLSIAGREWRITAYSKITEKPTYWLAWFILVISLIFSVIISVSIANLIRRREIVEQLVTSRTMALQESEEQHRAVVENAVDGLLTIDEFGIVEKFNLAAQTIFGYQTNEVIGNNIKMLMPEPYRREHDGYLKNYHDTGVKKIIGIGRYVEGKRKDGSVFPIDLSVSEMKFGDTRKFSGIVRDISKRVALEKEREEFIETLTNSNEELERFAYVCSHDLQEPLRMIRSFSEKLEEHIGEDLANDEKGKKYFKFVIEGAIRAQSLIADILTYSSISSNTQILETVNVEGIVNVIRNNLLDSVEGYQGNITFDPLPEIQGNKTQLMQLFQNLINNGMKYQKVDVIPHVHIGLQEEEKHWIFSVEDNGIGMEERHYQKIFEVFQRLHRRSKYAGTGIGLSICKKVVERHGGSIWVESELGAGSVFYVKLLKE